MGKYVTTSAIKDIRTDMYAGVAADFFCSGVSPSHDWREKTKETHPIILFRVNIAAIGIVLDIAPDISASFLSFGGSM
jgi:hypothetical protein